MSEQSTGDMERSDPPCERCGDESDDVVDSPTIPWTKLALCDTCHEEWEAGEFEVGATVVRWSDDQ